MQRRPARGFFASIATLFVATSTVACTGHAGIATPATPDRHPATKATIELVESAPLETTLDHTDVPNAPDVWPRMIDGAKRTIDFAEFYATDAEPTHAKESRLTAVIEAVKRAAARGVRVRFLADALFVGKYPETLDTLRNAGATVRIVDMGKHMGGVLHAKYFVVDGEVAFVGSQNFDWRALTHIQEMGARVRAAPIASGLAEIFEADWKLAGGEATSIAPSPTPRPRVAEVTTESGESVSLFASPKGWLVDPSRWDLDAILDALANAKHAVDIQVLTYSVKNRDGSPFTLLDDAIRAAASRGVEVRLLVSSWAMKPNSESSKSLEALVATAGPKVEVRVITIPPWSGGEIPFARVAHAKYMIVDRRLAWIGTSNWEGDYFLKSRNVALVARGGALPARLDRIFEDGWTSTYTAELPRPSRIVTPDAKP